MKKRALVSVFDKTGIAELGRGLADAGYTLLSTGGTAETLRKAGVPVVEVSRYTGQPEILEGRVKTLHPRIHGGILADLAKDHHRADMTRSGIEPIALVIVNLYPFREVAARPDARLEDVIEMIDVGGPAMVRAAAKNHRHVGVVVDPADYANVLAEIRDTGALRDETRFALAVKAFAHTADYDAAIRDELGRRAARPAPPPAAAGRSAGAPAEAGPFPDRLRIELHRLQALRYGENPHQRGALYAEPDPPPGSLVASRQLQGKDLSFNNLLDLDAAWRLASDLDRPAAVIVKHNNPCGAATGATLLEAFETARRTDPASAFGGIVAFNREVDAPTGAALTAIFLECVVAPGYAAPALEALAGRTNLRVLETGPAGPGMYGGFDLRRITGGFLAQDWDAAPADLRRARVVTRRPPTDAEMRALDFAWRVARHVKSNAIVLAREERTIGIGAGQMSRVDSVRLAIQKASELAAGAVMASDAFFPFRDGLDEAARAGVAAVVQPGGSVKDAEVIAAADSHGMAMLFTGVRHFRH